MEHIENELKQLQIKSGHKAVKNLISALKSLALRIER